MPAIGQGISLEVIGLERSFIGPSVFVIGGTSQQYSPGLGPPAQNGCLIPVERSCENRVGHPGKTSVPVVAKNRYSPAAPSANNQIFPAIVIYVKPSGSR